jgi:hypothetical protein
VSAIAASPPRAARTAHPGRRRPEATLVERRTGTVHVIEAEGRIGLRDTCTIGHRLLHALDDGVERVVLDLSAAEPLATSALVGTVLRMERYGLHRQVRLVVVVGAATERAFRQQSVCRGLAVVSASPQARSA